jgi:hypothetical protein
LLNLIRAALSGVQCSRAASHAELQAYAVKLRCRLCGRRGLSSCAVELRGTSDADERCGQVVQARREGELSVALSHQQKSFSFASICLSIGAAQLTRRVESAWGGSRERGSCLLTSPPPQGGGLSPGQGEKPRKCAVSRVLGPMWRADAVSRVLGRPMWPGPEP